MDRNRTTFSPHDLPSSKYEHTNWYEPAYNTVQADELKAPRVRKSPAYMTDSQYDLYDSSEGSDDDERIRKLKHRRLRPDYKSAREENWNAAKVVNLSYQHLGHKFQLKNFMGILKRLETCTKLHLVDNELTDLSSINLPECRFLNLVRNHFASFKGLPTCRQLETLNLAENNISTLEGSTRFKNTLKYLDLRLNPITFSYNYRANVLARFPKLELLDGIPRTAAANQDRANNAARNSCVIS